MVSDGDSESSSRIPFLNSMALRPRLRIRDGNRELPNIRTAINKKIISSCVPIPNITGTPGGEIWVGLRAEVIFCLSRVLSVFY